MATKDIKFTASGLGQILKEIDKINQKASQKTSMKIDAETSSAESKINAINKKASSAESMKVDAETSGAESKIKSVKKQASGTETIKVDADTSGAENSVNALADKIKGVAAGAAIGAGVSAGVSGYIESEKAITNISNRLGKTKEEAEEFTRIGKNVYSQGWGESLEQINAGIVAISDINVQTPDFSAGNMEGLVETATKFTDTFGGDMQKNIRAAGQLTKNFGVSGEEAFQIMANGFKNGANASDDFIDTLIEYGTQYKELGFNAETFTKSLIKGAQTGAYNIDFMADAMKEFAIRSKDGSTLSAEGFAALGLNADEMTRKFALGGETAKGAFDEVINNLLGMQDPVAQNAAGVALFGTKFEDVGVKGISAFQGINTEAGAFSNSMDDVKPDAWTKFFNAIKVGFTDAFGWIGEKLEAIDWEAILGPIKWLANEAWTLLKPFVDGVKGFFDKVAENEQVADVLNAIATAILIVAAAFIVWQVAMWLLTAATTAFSIVFSPIGLIILGIILIIAAIIWAIKNWAKIGEWLGQKWDEFTKWISEIFANMGKWISDKFNELVEFIKSVPGKIFDFFRGIGDKIGEFFAPLGDFLKNLFNGIIDFFKTIPEKIGDIFKGLGDILKNALKFAINLLPSFISGPLKNVLGLGDFDADFRQAIESVGTITVDSSRFDFLPSQMASQTYNNQQAYTFNKGIESTHERTKLRINMKKVRGR